VVVEDVEDLDVGVVGEAVVGDVELPALGAVQEVLPVGSAGVRDRPLGPVARVVAET
jgi:hypothetical protein